MWKWYKMSKAESAAVELIKASEEGKFPLALCVAVSKQIEAVDHLGQRFRQPLLEFDDRLPLRLALKVGAVFFASVIVRDTRYVRFALEQRGVVAETFVLAPVDFETANS